jgi:diguanylate cyclase (GGDEF)-like protein
MAKNELTIDTDLQTLHKFELTKAFLRFFLIFVIYYSFNSYFKTSFKVFYLKYLPEILIVSNLIYILLLLIFKKQLVQKNSILKFFHYFSLFFCPLVFAIIVRFTGNVDSVFVSFFYFYLVVIPLAQINFKIYETVLSELFIISSYPLFLSLLGKINNPIKLYWQIAFMIFLSATIFIFYLIIKRENHKLSKLSRQFYELSIKDPLTGLFNRRFFYEILEREIEKSRRKEKVFTIAIGDLDNFKKINDTFGHLEGDRILTEVAQIIKDNIRKYDIAARLGGEEFAILLPETTKEEALAIIDRLREEICRRNLCEGNKKLSISFGLSSFPEDGQTLDTLLSRADRALYDAKRQGKNRTIASSGIVA